MSELLTFLASHLMFLFQDYGAKFVNSDTSGADGAVDLETKAMRMSLDCERGQISFDFQSKEELPDNGWFSYHIIRGFITGEFTHNAMLDKEAAEFLEAHMPMIINAFSPEYLEESKAKLIELEKADQKHRWG